MSDVDMRHRLNTYILKNPPEENISVQGREKVRAPCIPSMPFLNLKPGLTRPTAVMTATLGRNVLTLLYRCIC